MMRISALACLVLAACGQDATGISKWQARELDQSVWTTDYCASESWYADRECDEFCPEPDPDCDAAVEAKGQAFLDAYLKQYAEAEREMTLADWRAQATGSTEDYNATNAAAIKIFTLSIDPVLFEKFQAVPAEDRPRATLYTRRALDQLASTFLALKLGTDEVVSMLGIMNLRNEVLATFNNFKATVDGQPCSIATLRDQFRKETDPARRRVLWEALKSVGPKIAPKIVEGVKLANKVARSAGFAGFREYWLSGGDVEPKKLDEIFQDIDDQTREAYAKVKAQVDAEVAARYGIQPADVAIWHYDTEFFMDAPPSTAFDLDSFFAGMTPQGLVEVAGRYFARLGLDVSDVLARSDLYPREGKWPGAFTTSIDREGDIRVMMNTRPDYDSISTALHELGHAVDMKNVDPKLPFLLRTTNHIFTTEAMAMLFGAQTLTPDFFIQMAGADRATVEKLAPAIFEQYRRGELIFARYSLVMYFFEKALYENPDQDLDRLWWDLAERYQLLKRPAGRSGPDWATKTHLASNPVYYQNYMLGELLVAQLRAFLARRAAYSGPILGFSLLGRPDAVEHLKKRVFRVGQRMPCWELVKLATFEPLSARAFGEQMGKPAN